MNDELLVKYLLKETSEAEAKDVSQWLLSNPDNMKYFRHMQAIWDVSRGIAGESQIKVDEEWTKFLNKRKTKAISPKQSFQLPRYWLQLAAACFAGIFLLYFAYCVIVPEHSLFASGLETKNEVQTETLADGSVITMNKHSDLTFSQPLFKKERIVKMYKGEVFFRVKHDENKPFIIKAGKATITVLGTSFHVKEHNGKTEVIVESGLVEVEAAGRKIELQPKEKVLIDGSSGEFTEEKVTDNLHNYYVNNRMDLDNTPLWRVVEVLNEAYGVKIRISSDQVANLRMTTTLKMGDLNNILSVISETFDLSVERDGQNIIIKKNS